MLPVTPIEAATCLIDANEEFPLDQHKVIKY
jgi:hypothetical protein